MKQSGLRLVSDLYDAGTRQRRITQKCSACRPHVAVIAMFCETRQRVEGENGIYS